MCPSIKSKLETSKLLWGFKLLINWHFMMRIHQKDSPKLILVTTQFFILTVFYHVSSMCMEFLLRVISTVIYLAANMETLITFIVIIFIRPLITWSFVTINSGKKPFTCKKEENLLNLQKNWTRVFHFTSIWKGMRSTSRSRVSFKKGFFRSKVWSSTVSYSKNSWKGLFRKWLKNFWFYGKCFSCWPITRSSTNLRHNFTKN